MDIYFVTSQTDLGRIIEKMDYLQGWPSYEIQRFLEEFRAKSEPVTEENKTIRFVSLFLSDEAVEATEHGWEGQPEREGKGKGKARPKDPPEVPGTEGQVSRDDCGQVSYFNSPCYKTLSSLS